MHVCLCTYEPMLVYQTAYVLAALHISPPLPTLLHELMQLIKSCDNTPYHIKRAIDGAWRENSILPSTPFSLSLSVSLSLILLSTHPHVKPINSNYRATPGAASFCWLCCFVLITTPTRREALRCVGKQVITVY